MSTIKCEKCKREFKVSRSGSHQVICPYCKTVNHLFWTISDITKGIVKILTRL